MNRCPLCCAEGENVLWRGRNCRVVLVDDSDHAGFCRVIWNAHVKEMTELAGGARAHFMDAVFAVEEVIRALVHPDKINLASLGNQVPHLHWHVIPRFVDDGQFPDAIWAPARRVAKVRGADSARLRQMIQERLGIGV
ncbi:MAG: HIT family protein [Acidiferrobacterales bacterium]